MAGTNLNIQEMKDLHMAQANKEVETPKCYLPICASCTMIRADEGYWNQA